MRAESSASILIVEDDKETATYLKLHLQQVGYDIAGMATTGAEAIRLDEELHPGVIIMDILLSGEMDGIEAAQRILDRHDVPILYLTAHSDPEVFARAKFTDPSAYLIKPFNPRELHLAIELAVQRHSSVQQRELSLSRRIQHLLDTMSDGFVMLDHDWRYVFVNRRAGEICNRVPELMIGRTLQEEFPEVIGQPFYTAYQRVMNERVTLQLEEYFPPWDRWFETRLFPTDDGMSISFRDVSERKIREQELAMVSAQLKALSGRLLKVQEDERRLLARELHDEIGQSLTALKITLQGLGMRPETSALQAQIETAVSVADAALAQVRKMSLDLRPPQLDDLGLPAAIRWNLSRQAGLAGIGVHFSDANFPERLPEPVAIACYRISQEALTNVIRHARASNLWIRAQVEAGELCMEIRDDGSGFDARKAFSIASGSGMGMLSMKERATLAGGRLEVESVAGRGTTICAIFPLAEGR